MAKSSTGGVSIGRVGNISKSIIAGRDVIVGSTGAASEQQPQEPNPETGSEYDLAAIRKLLLAAFTPQTLRRFCVDRPVFRPIIDDIAPNHGLNETVDAVIDYCRTKDLLRELLRQVKDECPRHYERFSSFTECEKGIV